MPAQQSSRQRRADVLPLSLPPRGLDRIEAAANVGVSATKFDAMVEDGRMPAPKKIDTRSVWDRRRLDVAFDQLPDKEGKADADDDDWGVAT